MNIHTPLKNSVSKGVGSRAFGIQGIKFLEFSLKRSALIVLKIGGGVALGSTGITPGGASEESARSRSFGLDIFSPEVSKVKDLQ